MTNVLPDVHRGGSGLPGDEGGHSGYGVAGLGPVMGFNGPVGESMPVAGHAPTVKAVVEMPAKRVYAWAPAGESVALGPSVAERAHNLSEPNRRLAWFVNADDYHAVDSVGRLFDRPDLIALELFPEAFRGADATKQEANVVYGSATEMGANGEPTSERDFSAAELAIRAREAGAYARPRLPSRRQMVQVHEGWDKQLDDDQLATVGEVSSQLDAVENAARTIAREIREYALEFGHYRRHKKYPDVETLLGESRWRALLSQLPKSSDEDPQAHLDMFEAVMRRLNSARFDAINFQLDAKGRSFIPEARPLLGRPSHHEVNSRGSLRRAAHNLRNLVRDRMPRKPSRNSVEAGSVLYQRRHLHQSPASSDVNGSGGRVIARAMPQAGTRLRS